MPHNKPSKAALKKAKKNMKPSPPSRRGRRPTLGQKVPRKRSNRKGY